MTSSAHIPSPNVVVTAPLSAEARALWSVMKFEMATIDRVFGGSFTTPTAKEAALRTLFRIEAQAVSLRKAMRAS